MATVLEGRRRMGQVLLRVDPGVRTRAATKPGEIAADACMHILPGVHERRVGGPHHGGPPASISAGGRLPRRR